MLLVLALMLVVTQAFGEDVHVNERYGLVVEATGKVRGNFLNFERTMKSSDKECQLKGKYLTSVIISVGVDVVTVIVNVSIEVPVLEEPKIVQVNRAGSNSRRRTKENDM